MKTLGYIEIEKNSELAENRFRQAFENIKNAKIKKTQKNKFALSFKYPILIGLCVLCIVALITLQIVWKQTDAMFIACESIIFVGLTGFIVLLAVSWRYNIMNARCAEVIEYYNDDIKCVKSKISGGGIKVEWEEARFYFSVKNEFELFDGKNKEYKPFMYKKMRGHCRNYVLLDADAIIANFFRGAEVLWDDGDCVTLSSGFKFCISDGVLKWMEIGGMYSECYENNFPIFAPFSASSSYVFRYEFSNINKENYVMILPEITKEACKMYFLQPPHSENILIENLKK